MTYGDMMNEKNMETKSIGKTALKDALTSAGLSIVGSLLLGPMSVTSLSGLNSVSMAINGVDREEVNESRKRKARFEKVYGV